MYNKICYIIKYIDEISMRNIRSSSTYALWRIYLTYIRRGKSLNPPLIVYNIYYTVNVIVK